MPRIWHAMKKEVKKRKILADTLINLRDEASSKRIFNKNHNTAYFRIYAASYLMGVMRGLSVSARTRNQVERIIGI